MSDFALNAFPVVALALAVPRRGCWVADLEVDTETNLTGAVSLSAGDDTWTGAVARGGVFEGQWRGRIIGGRGGLGRALPARFYRGVPARMVAADICREAGEVLAPGAPALDTYLQAWTRTSGQLGGLLEAILGPLGLAWRVLPSGDLSAEPWPTADVGTEAQELSTDPRTGVTTFAVEGLDLLPGMVAGDRVAGDVVYTLDGAALRAQATWQ